MKRGYLLPEGCKDLIDVIKLKPESEPSTPLPQQCVAKSDLPPVIGEIVIPQPTLVGELAGLLKQKPFQIVADLMQFGVFANVNQALDFDIISSVARKYGFIEKRAA